METTGQLTLTWTAIMMLSRANCCVNRDRLRDNCHRDLSAVARVWYREPVAGTGRWGGSLRSYSPTPPRPPPTALPC